VAWNLGGATHSASPGAGALHPPLTNT
jgi:hypothetical protein